MMLETLRYFWNFFSENKDPLSVILTIPGILFGLASMIISIYSLFVAKRSLHKTRPIIRITDEEHYNQKIDLFCAYVKQVDSNVKLTNAGNELASSISIKLKRHFWEKRDFKTTKMHLGQYARSLGVGNDLDIQIKFENGPKKFKDLNEFGNYYYGPNSNWGGGPTDLFGPDKDFPYTMIVSYTSPQGAKYMTKIFLKANRIIKVLEK